MLVAEKGNRRVRIADEKKDEYIGMGYTVKNMDGSVISAPKDPKKRIAELEAELKNTKEASENQIADLEGKLEEAHAYAENADKRIAELEAELKAASLAAKKETKSKSTATDK